MRSSPNHRSFSVPAWVQGGHSITKTWNRSLANDTVYILTGLYAVDSTPIVFTSLRDPGMRSGGDWGWIVILGRAPTNQDNPLIEGGIIPGTYGGGAALIFLFNENITLLSYSANIPTLSLGSRSSNNQKTPGNS